MCEFNSGLQGTPGRFALTDVGGRTRECREVELRRVAEESCEKWECMTFSGGVATHSTDRWDSESVGEDA